MNLIEKLRKSSLDSVFGQQHLAAQTIQWLAADEIEALRDALCHMKWCSTCAESSWDDCEGGRAANTALAKLEVGTPAQGDSA